MQLFCGRYVETVPVQCADAVRMGDVHDGGWNVCMAPPFRLAAPCLVYSIGSVLLITIPSRDGIAAEVFKLIEALHHRQNLK